MSDISYAQRIDAQIEQYKEEGAIRHARPDSFFHVWNRYIAGRMHDIFAVRTHLDFYATAFAEAIARTGNPNIASIGSGEADLEFRIANRLIELGVSKFVIHCVDLSPILTARGIERAAELGLSNHFEWLTSDVGDWTPVRKFASCMANHSLHHVAPLEQLFSTIRGSLEKGGYFLSCDVIGRNGHMRWPDAYELVKRLWRLLPERQRRNNLSQRVWQEFINRDVSSEGFEGIRAQDILPLLVKNFNFLGFMAYGGLIETFTTVTFGPNFDMNVDWDRGFIDFVAYLNDVLVEVGYLAPTRMWAKMTIDEVEGGPRLYKHISPEFCLRNLNWLKEFGREVGRG